VPFGFFGRPRPGMLDNMCQRKRCVKGLARFFIVATISCMNAIKAALTATVIILAGCSGSAFSTETATPMDDAGGDAAVKMDGDDAGMHIVATDADAGETSTADAAMEAAMHTDAAPDAPVSACTCGDAGASCFYSVNEPPSGYGAPYPVTTVVLTPSTPTATFTATVAGLPQPYHDPALYDLDLSTFVNGGTIYIQGQVGDGSCSVSSYLMAQCGETSTAGSFPSTPLEQIGGVAASSAWMFPSYQFPAGTTVLHFGTEGSWGNPAGSMNTNKVTVLVQP
jgi:hypothetical protein